MSMHKVVVVFEVEASCMAAAIDKVLDCSSLWDEDFWPESCVHSEVITHFERDNEGQRVLYLPPEDQGDDE